MTGWTLADISLATQLLRDFKFDTSSVSPNSRLENYGINFYFEQYINFQLKPKDTGNADNANKERVGM